MEDSGRILFYASAIISFMSVVRGHLNLIAARSVICQKFIAFVTNLMPGQFSYFAFMKPPIKTFSDDILKYERRKNGYLPLMGKLVLLTYYGIGTLVRLFAVVLLFTPSLVREDKPRLVTTLMI